MTVLVTTIPSTVGTIEATMAISATVTPSESGTPSETSSSVEIIKPDSALTYLVSVQGSVSADLKIFCAITYAG